MGESTRSSDHNPDPAPVGRPSVAAERRDQILAAVDECLVTFGLGGTTLERIAAQAGISRSNLAHFIGNRDEIIDVAMAMGAGRFIANMKALTEDLPEHQRLPAFIGATVADRPTRSHGTTLLNTMFAAASHDRHAKEVLTPAIAELESWIEQMAEARYPDADPATRTAVAVSLPLLLREHDRTRTLGGTNRGSALADDVARAIEILLASLGPPRLEP